MHNKVQNGICLTLIGLCLGVLTGLSVNPVIQTVLTSLLTVVTTVVSIWAGFTISEGKVNFKGVSKVKLNIVPLTLLIISITVGAICGVLIRTHDLLGDRNIPVVKKEASISATNIEGLDSNTKIELSLSVAKKVTPHFRTRMEALLSADKKVATPPTKVKNTSAEQKSVLDEVEQKQRAGVLYNSYQKTCDIIKSFSGDQLIFELKTLGDDNINALIDSCKGDPNIVKNELLKKCRKH